MSNEVEIMYSHEEQRTIRVAGTYEGGPYTPAIEEVFLLCSETTANLVSVSDDEAPCKFHVRSDVMDRIADAWKQYRADEEKRKIEEETQARVVGSAIIAEAYAIAESCPAIKIVEHPGPQWEVSCPEFSYRYERVAQYPSVLLSQVKQTKDAYDGWMKRQEGVF